MYKEIKAFQLTSQLVAKRNKKSHLDFNFLAAQFLCAKILAFVNERSIYESIGKDLVEDRLSDRFWHNEFTKCLWEDTKNLSSWAPMKVLGS